MGWPAQQGLNAGHDALQHVAGQDDVVGQVQFLARENYRLRQVSGTRHSPPCIPVLSDLRREFGAAYRCRQPSTPPIGASTTGWVMPRSRVATVAMVMALLRCDHCGIEIGQAFCHMPGQGVDGGTAAAGLADQADVEAAKRRKTISL